MPIKKSKNYTFAIVSAFYISLLSTALLSFLLWFFSSISWQFCLFFFLTNFIISFGLIQYRSEKFILKNIQKIYDDVSFLDATTLTKKSITTDMDSLTSEVKKFAIEKKIEIENLKSREEYRREFLGNVSHELKTPLFTVQGYISTLLNGAMKDKELRKKYLSRAEKGVERLVYVVNDLDMISKFEMGDFQMKYEKFNLLDLVQNVFDLLEMRADSKNIILIFDRKYIKPIEVWADKEKIQQVLINFIENSIKYGKENGTTEVSLEDFSENKIILKVKDNGVGIEEQNISRLFERFYRVDKSGARSEGGSGLGLAIVKHIIEAHNERIYVKSTFGNESEFSFTLLKS